jgi:interleukin-1 receptor-associated kinase 4
MTLSLPSMVHAASPAGTFIYMSPEAVRGEVSFKSDAFAFGVVMLEALTGLPVQRSADHHANLLSLFEDEIGTPNDLAGFLDRRDARCTWPAKLIAAMRPLHEAISRCLEPRKRSRAEVAELIPSLEEVSTW